METPYYRCYNGFCWMNALLHLLNHGQYLLWAYHVGFHPRGAAGTGGQGWTPAPGERALRSLYSAAQAEAAGGPALAVTGKQDAQR